LFDGGILEKLEKNIYKITWPILVELIFFTLLGTIDTIMLSRYSDTAVGGVGVANQIFNLFGIFVNIIAMGIGVVASQYLGAGQSQKAKDSIVTGVVVNILLGAILAAIVWFFGDTFLTIIGTDPILMEDASIYLKIVGLSIFFLAVRVALSTAFRAFSKPKVVMYIMIVGNIVNILVNLVLIYGLLWFPEMGAKGAAIGTLSARILMVALLIFFSYKILKIKLHKIRLQIAHLKRILYVGIPAASENLMWNIAQVIIISFINQIGYEAVIVRTYVYVILSYIFIFSLAFANGNAIIVGYYIGEKEPDKAYRHTLKALKISFALVITMTLLLNIFATPIITLFTSNVDIVDMVRKILYFAVLIEIGRSMNLVYISALRSVGDTVFPVIMAVISMFGIAVGFSYYFGLRLEMGIIGVFLAAMIDELFRGFTMAIRWYRRRWTAINLIEN